MAEGTAASEGTLGQGPVTGGPGASDGAGKGLEAGKCRDGGAR